MGKRSILAVVFLLAGTVGALAAEAVPVSAPAARLSGMRRLSESEYRNSIADIFGADIEVQGRFEPDRRVGGLLSASSAILSITPAGFEAYTRMANAIAGQVVDARHRARLIACKPADAKAPDEACAGQVIAQYGLMLFRRPLTAEEAASRIKLAHDITVKTNDFHAGLRLVAGPAALTEDEVIAFARAYDPQWFHVDPARAAAGRWQGLIASGWQTCGVAMRLAVDHFLTGSESFGSPGLEYLKWLQPVRPGDALTLHVEVLDARRSERQPALGIVQWRWQLRNQHDLAVLELVATSLFDLGCAP